ncbi:MAG: hypothetical protein D6732_21285 [Methanobacteriota archaeon]|nr:MAG: hypothetical protein D6732_21285 [Euryarchaeota archaeon]
MAFYYLVSAVTAAIFSTILLKVYPTLENSPLGNFWNPHNYLRNFILFQIYIEGMISFGALILKKNFSQEVFSFDLLTSSSSWPIISGIFVTWIPYILIPVLKIDFHFYFLFFTIVIAITKVLAIFEIRKKLGISQLSQLFSVPKPLMLSLLIIFAGGIVGLFVNFLLAILSIIFTLISTCIMSMVYVTRKRQEPPIKLNKFAFQSYLLK